MKPNELAERSRTAAAENNATVLSALAGAGDAGLRPGELAASVGLPERTVRETVGRLVDLGLVLRDGKRKLWATAAGRSEVGAGTPGLALAPTLDAAIGCFPAEAQRAFVRLLLSAVIARHHLVDEHADGWAGFIALGPSKTGKTSIAKLVCRVYGLDELQAIKLAQDETAGSLVARRERDADTDTGYRVRSSPLLELPFATIDEWDKALEPVKSAASRLLLGHTATEIEGTRLTMRPTVLVCLNTGRDEGMRVLHEAHIRRSVVLDTTPLAGLVTDLDDAMHGLFQETAVPRLILARLRPPATSLPSDLRRVLRDELRAGLTEEGWALSDVEPLARVALGRAALTDAPLEQAVFATVLDALTCAATLGHAHAGFSARLAPQLGARGALVPNASAAEEDLARRRSATHAVARKAAADRLAFEAERERRAAIVVGAREELGRARDVERQAISRALAEAAKALRGARTTDALGAAWSATEPYLEQARRWRTAQVNTAAERARQATEARSLREQEAQQRKAERAWDAEQRKAERERWETRRSALAELIPYASAAELLNALGRLKVMQWVPAPPPPSDAGRLQRLIHAATASGHWEVNGRYVSEAQAVQLWQAAYDSADAQVVEHGGRARPKQAKPKPAPRTPSSRPLTRSSKSARRR